MKGNYINIKKEKRSEGSLGLLGYLPKVLACPNLLVKGKKERRNTPTPPTSLKSLDKSQVSTVNNTFLQNGCFAQVVNSLTSLCHPMGATILAGDFLVVRTNR